MATARDGAPDTRSEDPNRWARASVVVAVGVIAFFVVTYVYNAVRFADDLIIGDQWYWVDNVLIPYERGELGLFDALTYEYASLSHSHIPTLAVFLFSYEFFGLTLAIDRVIGVLALSGLLGIVFVEANRHLGRREALLTTAVGLAVAMPTIVALNWLERRVDRLAHDMDSVVTQVFTQELDPAPRVEPATAAYREEPGHGAADSRAPALVAGR